MNLMIFFLSYALVVAFLVFFIDYQIARVMKRMEIVLQQMEIVIRKADKTVASHDKFLNILNE